MKKIILKRIGWLIIGLLLGVAIVASIRYISLRQSEMAAPAGFQIWRQPGNCQWIEGWKNEIWAGGAEGLTIFRDKQISSLPAEFQDISYVHALHRDKNDQMWIAHSGGLHVFDGVELKQELAEEAFSVLSDDAGRIYCGQANKVVVKQLDGVWEKLELPVQDITPFDFLFIDSRKRLWLASSDPKQGGLLRVDGGIIKRWQQEDGLVYRQVNTITETAAGDIWFGLGFANEGCAVRLNAADDKLVAVGKADGMPGEKIRNIFIDNKQRLWFCSEYDGLAIFVNNQPLMYLAEKTGLPGDEVKRIWQAENGDYWLATDKGVGKIAADVIK